MASLGGMVAVEMEREASKLDFHFEGKINRA